MEKAFVERIKLIIEANLGNPDFGVEQLADEMHMSYSSLRRRISSSTGKSANQMIREIRFGKAFELLQQGELTIGEIAFRCGFSSSSYFTTSFQEYFGYSPSDVKGERGVQFLDDIRTVEVKRARWEPWQRTFTTLFSRTEWIIIPAAFIILISASVIIGLSRHGKEIKSIAVLYPKALTPNAQTESFCGGLQDQLLQDLKNLTNLRVLSRISTDFYKDRELGVPEIAKNLKAGLILESSVSQEAGILYLNVNLIDARDDRSIWSRKLVRQMTDAFMLQAELSKTIVKEMHIALLPAKVNEPEDLDNRDPDAVKLYKLGKYYSSETTYNPDRAVKNYRDAIKEDSLLAEAYLALASILNKIQSNAEMRRDTFFGESRWAIERAERLNGHLPEIHTQYGHYYLRAGDFFRSVEECSRELALNPKSIDACFILAEAWMSLGRWDKAFNALQQVLERWSYESLPNYHLGYFYELQRDFNKAEEPYTIAVIRNPADLWSICGAVLTDLKSHGDPVSTLNLLDSLGSFHRVREHPDGLSNLRAYINLIAGRYEEAIQDLASPGSIATSVPPRYVRPASLLRAYAFGFQKKPEQERAWYDSTRIYLEGLQENCLANRNDPRIIAVLGITYAGLGRLGKALEYAEKAETLLIGKPDALRGPYALEDAAYVYAKVGRYDKAIAIIRTLLSIPGPLNMVLLEVDPRWESLRKSREYLEFKKS